MQYRRRQNQRRFSMEVRASFLALRDMATDACPGGELPLSQTLWVQIPALLFISSVTVSYSLLVLKVVMVRINGLIYAKCLEHSWNTAKARQHDYCSLTHTCVPSI